MWDWFQTSVITHKYQASSSATRREEDYIWEISTLFFSVSEFSNELSDVTAVKVHRQNTELCFL